MIAPARAGTGGARGCESNMSRPRRASTIRSMRRFRVGLGQINPTVGDFEGNVRRIVEAIEQARALGCDLVAFPELAVPGYPPEDLLFKPAFIEANLRALDEVARASRGLTVVVGFVDRRDDIFNAAAILHDGERAGVYHKQYLPNYGVFDENRYFQAGTEAPVFAVGETTFAVNVCEDIWYPAGPTTVQALAGAELVVNVNGSPYHVGKARFREQMVATRAADDIVFVAYVNMVGGQAEPVFDGARPGNARLRAEERLHARRDRALGRDRFLARRGARRGGARPRERGGCGDAVALLLGRDTQGRPAAGEEPRDRIPHDLDHTDPESLQALAREGIQGAQGGRHRREPPGPHPRQPPHGALEQVRVARADDGQQERVQRGLHDALRRHGRRLRGDQGRPQDARLRGCALRERARGARGHPGERLRTGAVSRAPPGPDGPGHAPALRRARSDSGGLRRGGPRRERPHCAGLRAGDRPPGRRHGGPERVQAPSGADRREDHAARVRARLAPAHRQPLPRALNHRMGPRRPPPSHPHNPIAPAEPALEPQRSNSRQSRRSSGGRQSLRDENSRATLPACLPRCLRDGTSRPADRAGTGIRTTVLICIVWRRDSRGYPVARGSPSLDNSGASPHASCRESAPPSRRRSDSRRELRGRGSTS